MYFQRIMIGLVVLFVTCSAFAQFGAPSRQAMLGGSGGEKGFFVSAYFGSNAVSGTNSGVTSTTQQPNNGAGFEFVLNRHSTRPVALGFASFRASESRNLETTSYRDLYLRGYFSTVWGASVGRLEIENAKADYFTLFADLWPQGDSRWSAQIGMGRYDASGIGASGGISTIRVSYELKDGFFLDYCSRSLSVSDTSGESNLTSSFLGFTKRF